jgi:hypothetical protein
MRFGCHCTRNKHFSSKTGNHERRWWFRMHCDIVCYSYLISVEVIQ